MYSLECEKLPNSQYVHPRICDNPGPDTAQSELECILIKSPYMKGPTKSVERTKEGLSVLTPPSYELDVNYMRLGSDNRTVRAKRKGRIIVGHHGMLNILTDSR